jgi:hypothetical protein
MIDLRGSFTLEIKKKAYTGFETALKGNWEALDSHRVPCGVDVCKERALPLYEATLTRCPSAV